MDREYNFTVNDYVFYLGDSSTSSEPLHSPDVGKIIAFRDFFEKERINLHLLNKNEDIWCDYDKIRSILTTKKLLQLIGFEEIAAKQNKKIYKFHNLVVSDCAINFINKQLILLGFCAADFTLGFKNLDKYVSDGKFDLEKFYNDFQSLQNANDLFNYLREHTLTIDAEKILTRINLNDSLH
jgi:hypothetical protein